MHPELSVAELAAWLKQTDKPALLDVREPWEVNLASLANATAIPMGQVVSRMAEIEALADTQPVVVFCHHGVRSLQVVAYLQRQGVSNTHNLAGGIDAWSKTVDATVALY